MRRPDGQRRVPARPEERRLTAPLPAVPPAPHEPDLTGDPGDERPNWHDRICRAEAVAAAAREDVAFLGDAAALLATADDETTALARLGDLIVPRLADWCVFDMLRPDGSLARTVVTHGGQQEAEWARTLEQRYPIDPVAERNIVVRVLQTRESLLASELPDEALVASARDAEHLAILRGFGIHSTIIVALAIRDEILGAVTFVGAHDRRRYGPSDLVLAEALARQTSIAIDGARRRQAAERAAARTGHLQTVTAALGLATTPTEVAKIVVEQAVAALEARAMSAMLLTPDGTELESVAETGYDDALVRTFARLPLTSPWPIPVSIRAGAPLWISSRAAYLAGHPELAYGATAEGDYAFAAIPLEAEGQIIGGLGISFATVRDFTAEDRAFAEALARPCAQALARARLYQAERQARAAAERDRRRAAFLAEASARLASSLEWEVTLAALARLAVPALADWCIVDARTDGGGLRRIAVVCADPAQEDLAADLLTRPLVQGRSLGGARAFATGKTDFLPEVGDEVLRQVAAD